MLGRTHAGFVALLLLLPAGFSAAEETGRIEPLDGTHRLNERSPLASSVPQAPLSTAPPADSSSRPMTPFAAPMPPNQLTPAPLLPFHPNGTLVPNRPLMPAPQAPSYPPDPAHAGTRAHPSLPAPFSGGGRAGR
jgi:hypothetical protein